MTYNNHTNHNERQKMKLKLYKNGALATMERTGALYTVLARAPSGTVLDKNRCDTYPQALEYFRAFCALAKAAK